MGFLRSRTDRTGRRGERLAARALKRRGYRVLARRWRTPAGEIDLLCLEGGTFVVVEVKTTATGPLPAPRIDAAKRARLAAARRYVARLPVVHGARVRIDVVLVRLAPRDLRVTRDLRE